ATEPAPRVSRSLPDIPPALDALVASMLAPLESRVRSVAEIRERLTRLCPELESTRFSLPPRMPPPVSGVQAIGSSTLPMARTVPMPRAVVLPATRARRDRLVALVVFFGVLAALLSIATAWGVFRR